MIEALLINLIVNSVRASESGQQIELTAELHGGTPCLLVSDHGAA